MHQIPDLTVKIAVSRGSVRRFATGDPEIRLIDVLAGATVARLAIAEHLAGPGEIIIDQETMTVLQYSAFESRSVDTGERFFVLDPSFISSGRYSVSSDPEADALPIVYERETTGHGLFLTELRPTTALFVRFIGIDYDNDEQAK